MNISLHYCHIGMIELDLACFTTQVGLLMNTAIPVDVTQFGSRDGPCEGQLAAVHIA